VKPFLRSSLRILAIVLAALTILLALAAAAITQPTFSVIGRPEGPRADPGRLRRHVAFLTREVSPRDSDHPENLDRAAAYLREEFAASSARVTAPSFQIRGRTYRNVVTSFGPESGPLLVVGAHYDSFGGFSANPGADDNASGTAGLVEIGRLLAGQHLERRVDLVPRWGAPSMPGPWRGGTCGE
jgi:hypothetical protein